MRFAQTVEVCRRPIDYDAVGCDQYRFDVAFAVDRDIARTVAREEIVSGRSL